MSRFPIAAFGAALLAASGALIATHARVEAQATDQSTVPDVDTGGNIRVPADYRRSYEFLGSWAIAADKDAGSKEMHLVYASRGASDAYRATGSFPEGAVLVKEVYAAATNDMTTGTVSHADKLKGWFVMVRDAKGAHPGNPLWGDGWGWSWFDADKPTNSTTVNRDECQACHVPARASSWVYVSGYPALRKDGPFAAPN